MTVDHLRMVGEDCLKEYESFLKVFGIRDYDDAQCPVEIRVSNERSLDSFSDEEMIHEISKVLNKLAELDGFTMSGPRYPYGIPGCALTNLRHGDLSLTIACGSEARTLTSFVHITCWYYPVQT